MPLQQASFGSAENPQVPPRRIRLHAIALAAVLTLSRFPAAGARPLPVDPEAQPQAAHDLGQRIIGTGDHGGLPFVIVHKRAGIALVYHGDGRLAGVSRVLLGLTAGDLSSEGVGERTRLGTLRMADRTTPAGRFDSEPGHTLDGEAIVWIDYASALAIHRLRPGAGRKRRELLLASAKAGNRRASAGCVVVPEDFFDRVVVRVLGRGPGVVYVMPESRSWRELWPRLADFPP